MMNVDEDPDRRNLSLRDQRGQMKAYTRPRNALSLFLVAASFPFSVTRQLFSKINALSLWVDKLFEIDKHQRLAEGTEQDCEDG